MIVTFYKHILHFGYNKSNYKCSNEVLKRSKFFKTTEKLVKVPDLLQKQLEINFPANLESWKLPYRWKKTGVNFSRVKLLVGEKN